jgi:hypothetical protein
MKLVPTPSLFHSRNSLLNPLSLMNPSRLFRNFVFLFSLLGLGSLAWGERYETVFVYTDDTEKMSDANARLYLQSNECISTDSITIPEGEVAYVFASDATTKPSATTELTGGNKDAFVYGIFIDTNSLDSNITRKSWNMAGGLDEGISNFSSSNPIPGPATIRILIKPWSAREGSWASVTRWSGDDNGNYLNNWDFKASEGYITFRIVGSEQAPSKRFATVIPENASTNIRVVLEQSTDLINWTTAAPGVFPPSTAKRFFRVRSEEE